MKKIKTSLVVFEEEIEKDSLSSFRAAIAGLVGKDNILFHHHREDDKYLYRYPLIQYKVINNHPAIFSMEEGAGEVLNLIEKRKNEIKVHGKKMSLNVLNLHLKQSTLQVWDKFFSYHLRHWIALNKNNYKDYNDLLPLKERVLLLEKTLVSHILSFAEGVGWNVDKKIELFINDIHKQRWVKYKNIGLLAFDITFTTNVSLPDYVGLGKAVSVGFGAVKRIRKKELLSHKKETESTQEEIYE
jgi:hypothetical protein